MTEHNNSRAEIRRKANRSKMTICLIPLSAAFISFLIWGITKNDFCINFSVISSIITAFLFYFFFMQTRPPEILVNEFFTYLTKDDFTFKTDSRTVCIDVSLDGDGVRYEGKVRKLNGKFYHKFSLPADCLGELIKEFPNGKCISQERFFVEVTDENYQRYLSTIDDIKKTEVQVFILTATLDGNIEARRFIADYKYSEMKRLSQLSRKERNSYEPPHYIYNAFRTTYIIQRYNLLNLVTDNEPFTEADYGEFYISIKRDLEFIFQIKKGLYENT